ncbi:MAG TPA: hypothetical protein VGR71_01330, partial [Nitrospira sp.]|nr:hypothetical protein [Nitrospira sp.]
MSSREDAMELMARLLQMGLGSIDALPLRTIYVPIAGQQNAFERRNVVDTYLAPQTLIRSWPKSDVFKELIKTLQVSGHADVLYKSRPNRDGDELGWHAAIATYLGNLFADYIRAEYGKFDMARFMEMANQWLASIEANRRAVTLWAPLFSFDMPTYASIVEFKSGVALTKPSQDELAVLVDEYIIGGTFPSPPLGDFTTFFLTAVAECPVGQPLNPLRDADFTDVATAIRLAADGEAGIRQIGTAPRPGDCRPRLAGHFQIARTLPTGLTETQLLAEQLDQVQWLLDALPAAKAEWSVAIRRFSQMPDRVGIEDRLIDAVIALEALLSPEKAEEISYRFRLRGAWLLGQGDRTARESWQARLKDLYDLRSDLVHGNAKRLKSIKPEQV